MRKLLTAVVIAGATLAAFGTVAEAQPRLRGFYDQQGQFRGQAWCWRRGPGIQDCSFYTYEQCMMAVGGLFGFCERSPWSYNAQPGPAAPKKRKATRHRSR